MLLVDEFLNSRNLLILKVDMGNILEIFMFMNISRTKFVNWRLFGYFQKIICKFSQERNKAKGWTNTSIDRSDEYIKKKNRISRFVLSYIWDNFGIKH